MSDIGQHLYDVVCEHAYPLLFATISGAHLYGFASPDSDFDIRGVHLLPLPELVGLNEPRDTIESAGLREGLEIDLVTHDVGKFFRLLLKANGYVLEQLYSPLVVLSTDAHRELKEIAAGCITRHHVHHYLGFAQNQWKLYEQEPQPRIKPLLYVYRVLLTGIHLMQTGQVQANLPALNREFALPQIDELIARKASGEENQVISRVDQAFHETEYQRLRTTLEDAGARTSLPEQPTCRAALNDLLLRIRLGSAAGAR